MLTGTRRRSTAARSRSQSRSQLFDRFQTFAQGGIDTKDVSFLVLFAATFLACTFFVLDARRWRGVRS
jgi:hypothetical protein